MSQSNPSPDASGKHAAQMAEIARGTQEVLTTADLVRKLGQGRPLTIKAGFGGQKFIAGQLDKIRALRQRIDSICAAEPGRRMRGRVRRVSALT